MSKALVTCAFWFFSAAAALAAGDTADLLTNLKSDNEQTRIKAIDSLGEHSAASPEVLKALSESLKDDSALVRAHAAAALGRLGPAARPVVKALTPLLADPNARVRCMAVRAWSSIDPGPDVTVSSFAAALADADPTVRAHVLSILAEIGKPAVPTLIKALANEKTAHGACLVLSEIGPEAAEAVPALIKTLQSSSPLEVRREAVLALGSIGPAAAPAVDVLVKTLAEKDVVIRCGASFALGQIGPKAKAAVPALEKKTKSNVPMLKLAAAWALAKIEPNDEARRNDAVVALSAALKVKDMHIRRMAIRGLVDLRAKPETIIEAVKNAHISFEDNVAQELLYVAAGLGKPAVPLLIDSLRYERIAPLAASLLGQMGPEADDAVPVLVNMAANGHGVAVRCEALLAIGAIAPDSPRAVRVAVAALSDKEEDIRYAGCFALGKIGNPATEAVPRLEKLLSDKDEFLALASAWALAHIEPGSAEIAARSVPVLIGGLKESEPRVRCEAAAALGQLGPLAKAAVPALQNATRDKDEIVREAADDALESIGR